MQVRLTTHVPDAPAQLRRLEDGALIGRGDDCGVRIDHPSVSRLHASLEQVADAWRLRDLGSKNGSYLDGARLGAVAGALSRAHWLRFGDVLCEFALLDAQQVAAADDAESRRRDVATLHTMRLDRGGDIDELLAASLAGVLALAQCERGFILVGESGQLQVRASQGLDAEATRAQVFRGSAGAVRRALQSRRSVVSNDIGTQAWLAERQSVVGAGLNALVCLPLVDGDAAIGVVYADRMRAGPAITTLDLELLEAFAERIALWIVARDMLLATSSGGAG